MQVLATVQFLQRPRPAPADSTARQPCRELCRELRVYPEWPASAQARFCHQIRLLPTNRKAWGFPSVLDVRLRPAVGNELCSPCPGCDEELGLCLRGVN